MRTCLLDTGASVGQLTKVWLKVFFAGTVGSTNIRSVDFLPTIADNPELNE